MTDTILNIIHISTLNSIPCYLNSKKLISFFSSLFPLPQVWFQNRRMKDKRQRIAIAWPYAAIYSDPTMAASILQACANSVGMAPYGAYAHPMIPQIPQVMPPQMHTSAANAHFSYGAAAAYHRYGPYPIPPPQSQRTPQQVGGAQLPSQYGNNNHSTNYGPLTIPKPQCTPPHDLLQSPSSQNSLSPGSDKEINHNSSKFDLSSSSNDNSPVKSLASPTQGLLMTATASQPSPLQTTTVILPEKPKLFKPYKSEA